MEWISVKDRMPDTKAQYLVYANDIVNSCVDIVWLETHHYKRWIGPDGFETYAPIVTHWMPLPEPPTNAS